MDVGTFLQHLVNGMTSATLYALVAVGITLVFGLTGMVNFAHGEFMMLGAFVVYMTTPDGGSSFLLGLFLAIVAVAVLSYAADRGLFRHTFGRPINGFIVSLGLILIMQNAVILEYGVNPRFVDPLFGAVVDVADVRIGVQRLFAVALALVLLALTYLLIHRTTFGLSLRATAMDRDTAGLIGVNVPRVITMTFILGGVLAGAAGGLLSTLTPIYPLMGHQFIVKGFAVALVGGLGSVNGALAAALLLGVSETAVSMAGWSEWVPVFAFVLMIGVLIIRPQGLLRGVEGSSVV